MSWNGAGTYSLPAAYFPEADGNLVDAARYNGTLNDIAAGLNVALAKNGQNAATANLPMGGFKHTGAGAGSTSGEYVVYGQTGVTLTGTTTLGDLATTGNTTLGNATSDTLDVGNGGIIKDASGNVSMAGSLQVKGTNKLSFTDTVNQTYVHAVATNTLALGTSGTERMRIDSSGNTILLLQSAAPTLAVNYQMVFVLTANNTLSVVVRGSDGVSRTGTIALT